MLVLLPLGDRKRVGLEKIEYPQRGNSKIDPLPSTYDPGPGKAKTDMNNILRMNLNGYTD
jgi:hypothetical protein